MKELIELLQRVDGDIYGEDQAISVLKKQYAKHIGEQPITTYERLLIARRKE